MRSIAKAVTPRPPPARLEEVIATHPLEGGLRIGTALIPGLLEIFREEPKTTDRNIGQKLIAIAEMTIRRGGTDAGHPRRVGKGEAGRAFLGDQAERRL